MKITPCSAQPKPSNAPIIQDPVLVTLDCSLYYNTENGIVPWHHDVYCSKVFGETVLTVLNEHCLKQNMGLVHIGFYNPRMARNAQGKPLGRWSNHAYGLAGDLKGFCIHGELLTFDKYKDMQEVIALMKASVIQTGRKPEIMDEGKGAWLHIGIWHTN